MKWINGLTKKAKIEKKEDWHIWFAWHPVVVGTVGEGKEERSVKAWFKKVLRKGHLWDKWCDSWEYEYKEMLEEEKG